MSKSESKIQFIFPETYRRFNNLSTEFDQIIQEILNRIQTIQFDFRIDVESATEKAPSKSIRKVRFVSPETKRNEEMNKTQVIEKNN